jgi:sporulation protein YlmC with PRC-barrel domain
VFGQETRNERRTVRPAGQIMDMDIRNSKNESLGHVEDCVINLKDGKVAYVVMARGQVLGLGGSFFAIAPEALKLAENGEHLMLNATNAEFENARGFDQNAWPSQPGNWGRGAAKGEPARNDNNQGAQGSSLKTNENLARISALTGLSVYGRNAENQEAAIGRVYDVALNCANHQVAYVAIHHGDTLGVGGKLVAVPWDALKLKSPALDPQRRVFYINATARDLETAPNFTTDSWPTEARFRVEGRSDN